jgi:hypothetical protein
MELPHRLASSLFVGVGVKTGVKLLDVRLLSKRRPDDSSQTLVSHWPIAGLHEHAFITHVGKELNRLEEVEAGLVHDPDEVYTEY